MAVNTDFQKGSFEKNAFKVLKGKKVKKKIVNNFENFSLMDLKLWEYIFEMFNYKIRQKKTIFSKLQTLTPPLRKPKLSDALSRRHNFMKSIKKQYGNPDSHAFFTDH